jgi:cupin fold WbuC family metalloprotein
LKKITTAMLESLSQQALQSPRQRANHNLHVQLDDPVQRLAIAMAPDTYVRPHRHPHTWELLYPLAGRFIVLHFDAAGLVTARTVLGEDASVIETPAGGWHAVRSLDSNGVIVEVKHGPYQPIGDLDYAAWSPTTETIDARRLNDWYLDAQTGDRWPG